MYQFKKKQEHTFWHSPLALIILCGVVDMFGFNVTDLLAKERETNKKKVLALEEIETLKGRQASLESDIARLHTDVGVEDAIREKYQVVKEGEKMVLIVDKIEEKNSTVLDDEGHGFWAFVKRIFR